MEEPQRRPNILVVNDDGFDATGIKMLAEGLSKTGDVYVCAPMREQSAVGHGITIRRTLEADEISFPNAVAAIALGGTPADCVKIGIELFRNRGVALDMVFSGFNHGSNLGTDTHYSGTVSAAIEGAMCGLPSAAMSINCDLSVRGWREPGNFGYAKRLAAEVARFFAGITPGSEAQDGKPEDTSARKSLHPVFDLEFIRNSHTILNINFPDLPDDEIKGLKIAPLSFRAYEEWFEKAPAEGSEDPEDPDDKGGYKYRGRPSVIGDMSPDESDVVANREGYAVMTPLHFDLTYHDEIETLREAWKDFK